MEEQEAFDYLTKAGYHCNSVERIHEGNSHYNFSIMLDSEEEVIAKFDKPHRISSDGLKRDYHYNGELSLEREASLCSLVKNRVSLPAPEVKGVYSTNSYRFLLEEKMPGMPWDTFVQQSGYSLEAYLTSLEFLGADIAKAQQ